MVAEAYELGFLHCVTFSDHGVAFYFRLGGGKFFILTGNFPMAKGLAVG